MNVESMSLPGLVLITPRLFGDARGHFIETWQAERYAAHGLPSQWVQDNLSRSVRGVLRGLHYQLPKAQGKLVYVLEGEVLDTALDIRAGSPTFGRFETVALSAENRRQLYVPPGFAHGFVVVSERATVAYKCTELYHPEFERGVRWDDPRMQIPWPVEQPILSPKDAALPRLDDVPAELLPKYVGEDAAATETAD